MCKVKIDGKDVYCRCHVNQLRTRLTSLPLAINSDSELSQDDLASTTSYTVQPPALRRSARIRHPRQVWMPA